MPSAKEVSRALARVRAVMPAEKKVDSVHRNIRLGLERISRVVPDKQVWTGVHVGGTNGKGSICTLLSGLFKLSGLSHGMYTSPAMPERHNGVLINGLYVNKRMYELELEHILANYKRVASGWSFSSGEDPGDLTPFELETAAAFRIFNKMQVKYGIVEVGMGGATDATNAMKEKSVTVISKIDLDHQEYLGNTIEEIAKIKAGIMRPGVPCIVDHTNPNSVLKVLRQHANSIGTQISPTWKGLPLLADLDTERFKLEEYETQNLLCAVLAFRHLCPNLEIDVNKLMSMDPYPPGRKERVSVMGLTGGSRQQPVLVDGAHNLLGAQALAAYVGNRIREGDQPVTWVMGLSASKSKPFAKLVEILVQPQDNFAFVEYAQGPNEPPPAPAELGHDVAKLIVKDESQLYNGDPSVGRAVQWACEKAGAGPVVVTGSLYLIRNFYNLEGVDQQRKIRTRRPGQAQLWHYTQLSQQRALTPEEAREFKQARRHWHLSPVRNPVFRAIGKGGQVSSPVVPERIRHLQRTAAHHQTQAEGYGVALKSLEKDLEGTTTSADARGTTTTDNATSDLHKSVDELKRRREEHLGAYSSAMFKVRGYSADPEKKFRSHKKIFSRPQKPKHIGGWFQNETSEESGNVASPPSQEDSKTPDTQVTNTAPRRGASNSENDYLPPREEKNGPSRRNPRFLKSKTTPSGTARDASVSDDASKTSEIERTAAEAQDLVDKLTGGRR